MQTGKQVATPANPAAVRPVEPDLIEKSRGPVTTTTAPNAIPRPRPTEGDRQRKTETVAAPVQVKADFHSLIGRNFEGVERLLGPADVTNDVPPGREWQYRDGSCTLVVRFYPDMTTLAYRVLSYAFESGEGTTEQARTTVAGTGGNTAGTSGENGASNGAAPSEAECRARLATRLKPER